MIDLHCHILPGIDDGAPDLTHSLIMAQAAAEEGIRQIVATPHHQDGKYVNNKKDVIQLVEQLNGKLKEENIPVTILPGQEIRLFGELINEINNGQYLPLNQNGPYLLIELPTSHVPRYTDELFFNLQVKGYIPIIAHPERNREIADHPDRLFELINKGACSQVTALSVAGGFGKKVQKLSLSLLEHNLAHFVASDAHNTKTRPFKMEKALDVIEKKIGASKVYDLTENAQYVIEGHAVIKEIPTKIKSRRILGIF
ncbi:tyrosine-protein phosphatase [Rossellomorea sp. BNER]|uniref:tyrosine-protein phosphatase n=1 Tax=Rossellomorea sp. BNER TaxID=2962031 RepID=UPI003AF2BA15|nr:tyrosine protein phosphatase [Rossellomorea sp. BNER]